MHTFFLQSIIDTIDYPFICQRTIQKRDSTVTVFYFELCASILNNNKKRRKKACGQNPLLVTELK